MQVCSDLDNQISEIFLSESNDFDLTCINLYSVPIQKYPTVKRTITFRKACPLKVLDLFFYEMSQLRMSNASHQS